MAFYDQDEDEGQAVAEGGSVSTGPQSSVISGQGSGGGQGVGATTQSKNAPDKPGNFVGIHDYLKANKPQAEKLGNKVAGQLGSDIAQAQTGVGGLQSAFDQKVKGGQIANIDTAVDEGKGLINKAATQGQSSADDAKRFGEIYNAQYKGPNSLVDATDVYQPVANQVNKASTNANLTKTEEGRQELLRNQAMSPTYSRGAQRFDSYLLGGAENQAKLGQQRTAADALKTQLGAEETAAGEKVSAAKTQAQNTADAIRAAFGKFDDPSTVENEAAGALGNYQNDINSQLASETDFVNALQGRVDSGTLTDADLQKLGLLNDSTYGVDFKNYFQKSVPTAAGVTDAQEKARYDALMQLGGLSGGMYGGASPTDFGSYSPAAGLNEFKQAVADKKNLYEVTQAKQKAKDVVDFFRSGGAGWDVGAGSTNALLQNLLDAKNADEIAAAHEAFNKGYGGTANYFAPQVALESYLKDTLVNARNQNLINNNTVPSLPTTDQGEIDWSQIDAPTGGAGKGGSPKINPNDILPPKKKGA